MAILKNGAWQGMTGEVSIYQRMGKTVSRSKPKTKKKITPAFAVAQQQFVYVGNLVRKMKKAIDIGFKDFDAKRAPYNVAISINTNKYKLARQNNKTDNLSWFEISKGELSNAASVTASIDQEGFFNIAWEGTEEWKFNHENDTLVVVVYNQSKDSAMVHLTTCKRSDQSAKIPCEQCSESDVLELFIFFRVHLFRYVNGGTANVSNSQWIGQFTIES